MTRRNRRPSPPSSSDEEQATHLNTQLTRPVADQVPEPVTSADSAQVSLDLAQVPGSPQLSGPLRDLDSALQALADRADDLSDADEPIFRASVDEVAENYISGAGLVEGGSPSTENAPASAEDPDCIMLSVTQPSATANESKVSNALGISARDALLLQQKFEETLAKHALVLERYKVLQREIEQDEANVTSVTAQRFKALQLEVERGMQEQQGILEQIPSGISSSATGNFPNVAVDPSLQISGKKPGASGASGEENRNSVIPPKGMAEFTQSHEAAAQAQGSQTSEGASKAKPADAPFASPAIRNRIIIAEAARAVLWQTAGPSTYEVFPPLDEKSELVKDMVAELKQAANAAFPDCEELAASKAFLALEASRYLQEAMGWPSIEGAISCLECKVSGSKFEVSKLPWQAAVPTPTFRLVPAPALPAQASNKPKSHLVAGGGNVSASGNKQPDDSNKDRTSATETQRPPISRVKPGKAPTNHYERVGELIRAGWRHDDIIPALEASKDELGNENLETAQDHLENLRRWRLEHVNSQIASKAVDGKEESKDRIAADSELAQYIAVNPDQIDVCLHLLDVHELNTRSHNADHFRTAANLMAKVKQEPITSKIAPFALKKIALAVVNDCEKCADLRAKEAAIKMEKEKEAQDRAAKKAREAELKAEQEAVKAKKESEEKRQAQERASKRSRTPPLPDDDNFLAEDPFDPADSDWLSRRRGGVCWECGEGDLGIVDGVDKMHLQRCEVCGHKMHKDCTRWAKVQHITNKQIKWACWECVLAPPAKWKPLNIVRITADANDTPATARTLFSNPGTAGTGLMASGGSARGGGGAPTPSLDSTVFDPNSVGIAEQDKLSIKIKSYTMWEALPAGHPMEVEHTQKGFGKLAYSNWKKTNVSLRDQARGKMGLLAVGLTTEMRVSVGNVLLQFPEIRPRPHMTEKEVVEWIKSDPIYSWVKTIKDEVLLKALDSHFSVLDPEPFLAMRFPSNIPQMNSDGTVNYMAVAHNAFAEQWLNALSELRMGGWDESMTNLRLAYVKALEACPTLHNEALCYRTEHHDFLISHLRAWTQKKSSEQAADKQRRLQIQSTLPPASPVKRPAPGEAKESKDVKALKTQNAALQNQVKQLKQSGGAAAAPTKKPEFFCNGCGYTFFIDHRKVPCDPVCVFEEHAEQNVGYKTGVPWPPGKRKLFWGSPEDYRQKYGVEMPERGKQYLEMLAKRKKEKKA